MSRMHHVRRTLAASAALAVAAWGVTALPAMADPGQGPGQGQAKHEDHADRGKSEDKGRQGQDETKGDRGESEGKGHQGNPQGPKPGQGPQGPKPGKGPEGTQGGDQDDPAGNNGTVKITPIGQDDGTPQNNPHVPCGFDIEWYGFDEGADIISTVSLAMQAPTKDVELTLGGPSEVFVGGDPATGAGTETGLDGEATYYPTFVGEAHPQQGYHIKLTVQTPGSQGADTKYKVFWVEPCETEVQGEEETPAEETPGTEVEGEQASDTEESDDTEVLGIQAAAPGAETEVMGAQAAADVPNAVDAGMEGGPVGALASPLGLALVLLGAALAGLGLVARRRTS